LQVQFAFVARKTRRDRARFTASPPNARPPMRRRPAGCAAITIGGATAPRRRRPAHATERARQAIVLRRTVYTLAALARPVRAPANKKALG
jgi:hypothetical protein